MSERVQCRICGKPTPMVGTQLCDGCWELEGRIWRDIELARQIIRTFPNQVKNYKPTSKEVEK